MTLNLFFDLRAENRRISICFDRIFKRVIVMMGENDVKLLKHKDTISS